MRDDRSASDDVPPSRSRPTADRPVRGPVARARRLRNYFLTGLIVAGPLAITIYITWWFINLVDGWVKPLVPAAYLPETYLPFPIPGFGLVIALIGLTLLGFLTANLVGKSLLKLGEVMLDRMPVVRGLYKGVKQIFETIFSQNGTSFRKVGLVEFPVRGHLVDRLHLRAGAGPRCRARCRRGRPCRRLPALHAEPDHRLLLLPAARVKSRAHDERRRRRQARHVGRRHPARSEPQPASALAGARGTSADGGAEPPPGSSRPKRA